MLLRNYLKIIEKLSQNSLSQGHGFNRLRKTLYGHEDVSGHGFIRAAKLLKMNNTDLPKACAERTK